MRMAEGKSRNSIKSERCTSLFINWLFSARKITQMLRQQLSVCVLRMACCIRPLITTEISNLSRQVADKVHIYKTLEHTPSNTADRFDIGRPRWFLLHCMLLVGCEWMYASVHLLSLTRQPSMLNYCCREKKANPTIVTGWKSARDAIMLCIWCRFARVLPLIGYCPCRHGERTSDSILSERARVAKKKEKHIQTWRVTQFRRNACRAIQY
jgi:hypothetical protein